MNLRVAIFHGHPNACFIAISTILSFLALSPTPSSVPIVLMLTVLLVYGRILFHSKHALKHTVLLTISTTTAGVIARLSPSLGALSTPGASILVLSILTMITVILTITTIYIDTRLSTRFTCTWSRITLFPALWATLWFGVSLVSPVGRLSAWSSAEGGGFYGWMAPYLGPMANDWVAAACAVVLSGAWNNDEQENPVPLTPHTASAAEQPRYMLNAHSNLSLVALLTLLAIPSLVLSNFPIAVVPPATTPLSVGCVLPSYQRYKHHNLTLDDYIRESKRLASSANVLLWPEGAVKFNSEAERDEGLAGVRKAVIGSVVGVSFEEVFGGTHNGRSSSRRTGIAIISHTSPTLHQLYYKRHLIPIVEPFSLSYSTAAPPTITTIELTPPKDVNKTDWADGPRYTRPIPLTTSISLDFADPTPFTELDSKPALILAPARTWDIAIGNAMWQQALQRAEELGTMVLWCDGGNGGVSGVAGGGFRDFAQVGLGSWVKTIGIQYPFKERQTPYARFGGLGLFLVWLLVLGNSVIDLVHLGRSRPPQLS